MRVAIGGMDFMSGKRITSIPWGGRVESSAQEDRRREKERKKEARRNARVRVNAIPLRFPKILKPSDVDQDSGMPKVVIAEYTTGEADRYARSWGLDEDREIFRKEILSYASWDPRPPTGEDRIIMATVAECAVRFLDD